MADDSGFGTEEPLIDVRSPGERWADAGRERFARLKALAEQQRLDVVALVWIVIFLVITLSEIYSSLRFGDFAGFSGASDVWTKLQLLSETGGVQLLFGCVVAVVFVLLLESALARLVLRLAAAGAGWVLASGLLGVAVTFHASQDDLPNRPFDGKVASAIGYLGFAALGLLVATLAWRCSTRTDVSRGPSDPAA